MPRARRYILRVRPDGTLRVTVPRGGSRREAEQFVRRHEKWIARERSRVRVESSSSGGPAWHDGSTILLRGEPVRISTEARGQLLARRLRRPRGPRGGSRRTSGPRSSTICGSWPGPSSCRACEELAIEHRLEVGAVSIRNQRSRWGSCARSGNIALNFRLVQMPPHVCDYVLLHELMHIKQQNHSRRFWRLVEAVCPGFRDAERWLQDDGKEPLLALARGLDR